MVFVLVIMQGFAPCYSPMAHGGCLKGVGCPGLKLFEGPPISTARVVIAAVVLVFAAVSDPEVCSFVFVTRPRVDVSNDVGLFWCYYLVISYTDFCNFHGVCFKGGLATPLVYLISPLNSFGYFLIQADPK